MGARSRELTAMAEADRLALVLRQMELVFPGAAAHAEGGTSVAWDTDPWARGEYPWFRPRDLTTLFPHAATPEGLVHFAGEQTSVWPGWMQGALSSGVRAAAEVHERALAR